MSEVKVNKISPRSGTDVTLGDSGDTFTIPSGATINNQGTATNFGATGSASWTTTVKTSTFTAVAGEGYFVNTTGGVVSVNLPAGVAGAVVAIKDYAGTFDTNAVTLVQNGSDKIGGSTDNKLLSTEGIAATLIFIDSTQGWLVTDDGLQSTLGVVPYSLEMLVIAGGAGGGGEPSATGSGGGGGAGGYRTSTQSVNTGTAITVTVGDGGAGSRGSGANGSDSSISGSGLTTITSTGGGGGANANSGIVGLNGGSGGGGSANGPATAAGGSGNTPSTSPSQGNNGSSGAPASAAGAGGGAGAVGGTASSTVAGNGGVGIANTITGSSVFYAGGGGGSCEGGTNGSGGNGGGGAGSSVTGVAGTVNTGGGGGGAWQDGSGTGGAGGKGVVILSMPDADYSGTTTGSPTVATGVSGKTILTFTGSGSYTG
jgi:hypothetical protein